MPYYGAQSREEFAEEFNKRIDTILKNHRKYGRKMKLVDWREYSPEWRQENEMENLIKQRLLETEHIFMIHDHKSKILIEFKDPDKCKKKLQKKFDKNCNQMSKHLVKMDFNNKKYNQWGRDAILRNFSLVFPGYGFSHGVGYVEMRYTGKKAM